MKKILFLLLAGTLFTGCASTRRGPESGAAVGGTKGSATAADGKAIVSKDDDLNEYAASTIADPLEPVNRATFWFNHQLYTFLLRPVSKTYETIIPKPLRKGIYNVFDNAEFPVRFVNDLLQGKVDRAGQETGKFAVNSVLGVGGLFKQSDKFPALAHVPKGSTGQTFAKWGIDHGCYIVLPVIGPSSVRDTVGLAGDYVLNPILWIGMAWGIPAWTIPVSAADTLCVLPEKFEQYDAATKTSLDRYLSLRSSYAQYRKEAAKK